MRYAHTGQDEEAAVICEQREPLELDGWRPPNPPISHTALQRCTGPSQQSYPAVLMNCSIAQGFSDHSMEPEVVMLLHQTVPKWLLCSAHWTDFNAPHYFPVLWR